MATVGVKRVKVAVFVRWITFTHGRKPTRTQNSQLSLTIRAQFQKLMTAQPLFVIRNLGCYLRKPVCVQNYKCVPRCTWLPKLLTNLYMWRQLWRARSNDTLNHHLQLSSTDKDLHSAASAIKHAAELFYIILPSHSWYLFIQQKITKANICSLTVCPYHVLHGYSYGNPYEK